MQLATCPREHSTKLVTPLPHAGADGLQVNIDLSSSLPVSDCEAWTSHLPSWSLRILRAKLRKFFEVSVDGSVDKGLKPRHEELSSSPEYTLGRQGEGRQEDRSRRYNVMVARLPNMYEAQFPVPTHTYHHHHTLFFKKS